MSKPASVSALVALWPSRRVVVDDLIAVSGVGSVTLDQVNKWCERNRIPTQHQHSMVAASARRGIAFTAEDMLALHAAGRSDPPVAMQGDGVDTALRKAS
ncbi:hypothetical protein ACN2XU_02635 [Primorskyibacter sp. 2E107]